MKSLNAVSEALKHAQSTGEAGCVPSTSTTGCAPSVCLEEKKVNEDAKVIKRIYKRENRKHPFRAEVFLHEGGEWTEGVTSDEDTLAEAYDACRSVEYCAEYEVLKEVEIKPERYLSVGAYFWLESGCAHIAEVQLSEKGEVTFTVVFQREGATTCRVLGTAKLLELAKSAQAISQRNRFESPSEFFARTS